MTDHDRLFKELLSTFFVEFVDLFLPEVSKYIERNSIVFLDKEVFTEVTSGERHEADMVVKARFHDRESFFLVHVEHQARREGDFGRRLFRYFARLYEKHGLPVYPVVVFSYDAPRREEPASHRVEFPDKTVLEFNYHVIQLNRLKWRDYLRHANPIASALMAKMAMKPEERPRVKLECLRLLATLRLDRARMQLISGFIDTYLQLSGAEERVFRINAEKTPTRERKKVMEIVTSWMREGLRRGRQEGRQEGELALVLRLLNHRFDRIGVRLQSRISKLPLDKLEALGEALLDFKSADDIARWLDEHQPALKRKSPRKRTTSLK
jgi:predicted transposase YdaD